MEQELTTSGILFLALGWGFVTCLMVVSLYKVLKKQKNKKKDSM